MAARGWVDPLFFGADVLCIAGSKSVQCRQLLGRKLRDASACQRQQGAAGQRPALRHGDMLGLQARYGHKQGFVLHRVQGGKDMAFLVFMVQGRSDVEIAQHIARSAAGRRVAALGLQVLTQALLQCQRALHALVAGFQHLKRGIETDGRRTKAGQRDAARRAGHRQSICTV